MLSHLFIGSPTIYLQLGHAPGVAASGVPIPLTGSAMDDLRSALSTLMVLFAAILWVRWRSDPVCHLPNRLFYHLQPNHALYYVSSVIFQPLEVPLSQDCRI